MGLLENYAKIFLRKETMRIIGTIVKCLFAIITDCILNRSPDRLHHVKDVTNSRTIDSKGHEFNFFYLLSFNGCKESLTYFKPATWNQLSLATLDKKKNILYYNSSPSLWFWSHKPQFSTLSVEQNLFYIQEIAKIFRFSQKNSFTVNHTIKIFYLTEDKVPKKTWKKFLMFFIK